MASQKRSSFLKADWVDLLFLSFAGTEDALAPYIPPGMELDRFEGSPILSLVAFRFLNARLLGVRPPWYHSFAELNLRFYVRDPHRKLRGVVFIREICPHSVVAWTARVFFNERFTVGPCAMSRKDDKISYSFAFGHKTGSKYAHQGTIAARLNPLSIAPDPDSFSHFLVDRYHGFSRWYGGRTLHYDVRHSPWTVQDAELTECRFDFEALYGLKLARLLSGKPLSTVFSEGSDIDLSFGRANRVDTISDQEGIWIGNFQRSLSSGVDSEALQPPFSSDGSISR